MKVLFVCTGNICRSPMAAECFRSRVALSGLSHVVVDSAGTAGIYKASASREAIRALQEIGLDLSGHRSKGVGRSEMRTADMVIAMSRIHLEELARRFPRGVRNRLLLRAFENGPDPVADAPDLPDPIGKPIDCYREQLSTITRCLEHLALHLRYPS